MYKDQKIVVVTWGWYIGNKDQCKDVMVNARWIEYDTCGKDKDEKYMIRYMWQNKRIGYSGYNTWDATIQE